MIINELKYTNFDDGIEAVKSTIVNNPYKSLAGAGIVGLAAKQAQQNRKRKKGEPYNPYQDYMEPAESLAMSLGSSGRNS